MDWITHEEDVWFDFRGSNPHDLTPGRFYRGSVDGFADFGVFVDLSESVTGLLHRSELDRRLESLDWDAGDEVFVQVKGVRDNGDVDLAWSIRQSASEFRGARVHNPGEGDDGDAIDDADDDDPGPVRQRPSAAGRRNVARPSRETSNGRDADDADDADDGDASESDADDGDAEADDAETADTAGSDAETADDAAAADAGAVGDELDDDRERVTIDSLSDAVGETVRIEGEVVGARQTGGPTIFELRDETAVVDCAAFVEAGVRAYPEVGVGDVVRLDGEVELRRDELQVETEGLAVLTGAEADAVTGRLDAALTERARPPAIEPLGDYEPVGAVVDDLRDAATAIRRAVFESRPVVVRHTATADGYVAGAAIERAVLPLVRETHAQSDAEYHYFVRRPLDDAVYGMDDATSDVTRMLQDRDRHGEKFPLIVLVGTGSTDASRDGLDLLSVYGAGRVVVDAAPADPDVEEAVDELVNPPAAGVDAAGLSTGALGATLAAAVNADVRDELAHLPAVSYWETPPKPYQRLAADAGYDVDRCRQLREAVALEAYYQSYEDKRELIADLLFEGAAPDEGGLAGHVSRQFRRKLDAELDTALANVERRTVDGAEIAVLDVDAYTHRFDFPPTTLLLDALHRRERGDGAFATVGIGTDELHVRATDAVDVRAVAAAARERAPEAGIGAAGVREGRVEFLSGARDEVREAVLDAVAEQLQLA
jgi:RecJ-like exonuclease